MRLAAVVLLLLLYPPVLPLHAQVGRETPTQAGEDYYVEGNVLGGDGKPVTGAKAVLSPFGSEMGQTVFTDSDGRFSFHGLGRGTYRITISGPGFQEYVESLSLAGGSQNLRVVLKSQTQGTRRASAPVVPAADLSVPAKALEHYQKGLERLEHKDYEAGLRELQQAVKEYPSYAAAHGALGIAYLQQHRSREAADAFAKALELNPSSYDAQLGMGLLSNDQKKWAEAANYLLKARQLSSEGWQVHYELGRAYAGMERFQESEASLKQARERLPDYPNLYVLLANAYVLQGKYPEAIAEMKYFVNRWPNGKVADQVRDKLRLLEKEVAGNSAK